MTSCSFMSVVIPAAGIGSRMASEVPKQYLHIAGKTVLEHTVAAFIAHPLIKNIVICLHPDDKAFTNLPLATHPKVQSVIGGNSRAESVLNGLQFLAHEANSPAPIASASDASTADTNTGEPPEHSEQAWVLVHDAARPGITQTALNRLIDAKKSKCGAILAMPVVDTVKKAAKNKTIHQETNILCIDATIDRRELWQAQTPQMFPLHRLIYGLQHALKQGFDVTDEASAMEYIGEKVTLVLGEAANFKITRPDDIPLAEFYLQQHTFSRAHVTTSKPL